MGNGDTEGTISGSRTLALRQSSSCAAPLAVRRAACPNPCRAHAPAAERGGISIVTNDTKAEWLRLVTEAFNKSAVKASAGKQIVVEVLQESSPQPTVNKLVAGEMQPVLWSPGDISWVEQANPAAEGAGQGAGSGRGVPAHGLRGDRVWHVAADGGGVGLAG